MSQQSIEVIEVPFCKKTGRIKTEALDVYANMDIAALVIPQPNFFGVLEDVDALTDWAHAHNALAIAVVNPLAMSLLRAPGQWGNKGADIACGEGQPLGVPMASGGPYYGFMCCKTEFVRQMPGRIVGRTVDLEGKQGFVLTLQAREQHIRRAKATSNICTNQGLLVTASTIYMSLMGPKGLRQVALTSHQNSVMLKEKLSAIKGVDILFDSPMFHEVVLRLPVASEAILAALAEKKIQGGLSLQEFYPELSDNCILVCATETKTEAQIDKFVEALAAVLHTHADVDAKKKLTEVL